jgi:hypothetical protein
MSLIKSERRKAKEKLLRDLALKKLRGAYGERGPIWSLGGQFMFNPTQWPDLLNVPLPSHLTQD